MIGLIILIVIIAVWYYVQVYKPEEQLQAVKSEIIRQQNLAASIEALMKSKNTALTACKNNQASCPTGETQTQIAIATSGLGDNQSALSHIENTLSAMQVQVNASSPDPASLQSQLVATNTQLVNIQTTVASY